MDDATPPPASFRAVIALWPTRAAMARDLAPERGGRLPNVREWHAEDKIPEREFDAVLAVATRRGFHEISYRLLTQLWKARQER